MNSKYATTPGVAPQPYGNDYCLPKCSRFVRYDMWDCRTATATAWARAVRRSARPCCVIRWACLHVLAQGCACRAARVYRDIDMSGIHSRGPFERSKQGTSYDHHQVFRVMSAGVRTVADDDSETRSPSCTTCTTHIS